MTNSHAMNDFNWFGEGVAIPHQSAIAVTETTSGEIEIRQERDAMSEDSDQIILVARSNLKALIDALSVHMEVAGGA